MGAFHQEMQLKQWDTRTHLLEQTKCETLKTPNTVSMMWNNRNYHLLLLGMQIEELLWKTVLRFIKLNVLFHMIRLDYTPWYLPKGDENLCPYRDGMIIRWEGYACIVLGCVGKLLQFHFLFCCNFVVNCCLKSMHLFLLFPLVNRAPKQGIQHKSLSPSTLLITAGLLSTPTSPELPSILTYFSPLRVILLTYWFCLFWCFALSLL